MTTFAQLQKAKCEVQKLRNTILDIEANMDRYKQSAEKIPSCKEMYMGFYEQELERRNRYLRILSFWEFQVESGYNEW